MLASTWMDPVLGVDIHILMIPSPAGPIPTPTPLPFIGIVLDPIGAAIGALMGGSTILINGLPHTNCGTNVYFIPGHPPVPPTIKGKADNDAELWFGALNVEMGGALAVRLGDIALSCNDPVRLPTSLVVAIPKGPLVLIPRPPVPDLKVIAFSLALKGLLAGFKWFRKFQKTSEFWKGVSKKLKGLVPESSRLRGLWDKVSCFLTGHPVDVASGRTLTSYTEIDLPGSLPLRFEMDYSSAASAADGPLGYGWSHNYNEALWAERTCFVYRTSDGRELEFDVMGLRNRRLEVGGNIYLSHARLTLHARDRQHFTITDARGIVKEFGAVGHDATRYRLLHITNRQGCSQRLRYDERGQLESVHDQAGRCLRFFHDDGRLARLSVVGTDQVERPVAAYFYSDGGDLVEARNLANHSRRYEYFHHLLVKETNKNGLSFYFQYDNVDHRAKCVRTWGDGGLYDHVISYAPDGKRTVVEDSLGHVTSYEMNDVLQVVRVTDAMGRATAYEYDETTGQLLKEIAPDGAERTFAYDARGNLTKSVFPDGAALAVEYNVQDQAVRAVDPLGSEWSWEYDPRGRLIRQLDPLRQSIELRWEDSRLLSMTHWGGSRTHLSYDQAGNLVSLTGPDGNTIRWSHDALGYIRTYTDPDGNSQHRHRDALSRVVVVDDADGSRRAFEYDPEGNVVRAVDPHQEIRFEYTGMNRLKARTQGETRVEFRYDTEENLLGIVNEHGVVYRFHLDAVGDVSEEYAFDDLRRRYLRDAARRIVLVARPNGKTSKLAYDKAGRVLSVTHEDGSGQTYDYRPDGHLIRIQNENIELRFERDALGQILREYQGSEWVASEYGPLGLRQQVSSSRGFYQRICRNSMGDVLAVDAMVRTETPSQGGSERTGGNGTPATFGATFERDRSGRELERQLPGGLRATWQRDRLGRPVQHEIWRGDTSIGARAYSWEQASRLAKIVDAIKGPVEYSHDAVGNLVSAEYADKAIDLRMPDAVGNLFRTVDRSDRRYGPAGELLEARGPKGTTRYEYDAEGNLARKIEANGRIWTYRWNSAGRLVRVDRPDSKSVTFTYDPLGRRLSKTFRGKTTRWIWDGGNPLHEWVEAANPLEPTPEPSKPIAIRSPSSLEALVRTRPPTGPPIASTDEVAPLPFSTGDYLEDAPSASSPITWLFEPDRFAPLGKLVHGASFGIVTDHLDTPLSMFDGEGRQVWTAELGAWGQVRSVSGETTACPFRWPGQYEDLEVGLYYNGFRYYDPDAGTYISRDPLGLATGAGLYAYVHDPLVWADPLGLAHDMIGMIIHDGKILSSTPYESGGTTGKKNQHEALETHTERKFLNDAADVVEPGDTLRMKGTLDPCSPGCQPAIRDFVAARDNVDAVYEATSTGKVWKWKKWSDPHLKGDVVQEVWENGKLIERWRYYRSPTGRTVRKKLPCS